MSGRSSERALDGGEKVQKPCETQRKRLPLGRFSEPYTCGGRMHCKKIARNQGAGNHSGGQV